MATVLCNKNKGYRWSEHHGCHFKGYLQALDGHVIREDDAIALLSSAMTYDEFKNIIRSHYGMFSIILEKESEVWIASDIARTMPIYYTSDTSVISDDIDCIIKSPNSTYSIYDDIRILEMYTTSFVGFENTVFKDVKQIELGCTARIMDGSIVQTPYYIHGKKSVSINSNYLEKLRETTEKAIGRLIDVTAGRQLVLSLSGGYDSRYLACSLKRYGLSNVICYTYGRADSYEVAQSKKVADALGFQWHNIEYNDVLIKSILKENQAYIDYANRPDYIVYLQNYLAVKTLHDKNLIPTDSVFITGLCNDMPTGYYIPTESIAEKFGFSIDGVANYNLEQRFVKFKLSGAAKDVFRRDIIKYLEQMAITVTDYESFVNALDCLETANFHSHCYINMNAVHEFFGYEWLLPCWDRELLDFWYSLPAMDRKGQKVYEEFIIHHLAEQYGIGTEKQINISASTPFKRALKRKIGAILVRVAYPFGIPMRRNTDINNMSVLEIDLYKSIVQKKAVKADRAALILLLTIYMMEHRYGTTWFNKIRGYLI